MRKKNFKGRCEKRVLGKCVEVCRTYDTIQYAYADLLQASDKIKEIRCNVLLEGLEFGEYTSDFVCTKMDGDLMVRECVFRKFLIKPLTVKLLDASRDYHCEGYTEQYLSGGNVPVAYNPEDVTSVWVLEDGVYTEFTIIESRFEGKDLTAVQELQTSQRDITRGAVRDNLQAQINLAQHIEAIAGSGAGHGDVHMKNIRSTRRREQAKRHRDYMKEGTSRE